MCFKESACLLILSLIYIPGWGGLKDGTTPKFSEPTVPVILDLGGFDHGKGADAEAISADGTVVVGVAQHSNYLPVAFKWTLATGMWSLDQSFFSRPLADARAVNSDGSVIVGGRGDGSFIWTQQNGMIDLGHLPGQSRSLAEAVSLDGKIVAGVSDGTTGFIWTKENGMQELPGKEIAEICSVSSGGKIIFGNSMENRAHIVRWDEDHKITRYVVPRGAVAGLILLGKPTVPGDKKLNWMWKLLGHFVNLRVPTERSSQEDWYGRKLVSVKPSYGHHLLR